MSMSTLAVVTPVAANQRCSERSGGTVRVLLRPGAVRLVIQRRGAAAPVIDDRMSPAEARWMAAYFDGWFDWLTAGLRSAADRADDPTLAEAVETVATRDFGGAR